MLGADNISGWMSDEEFARETLAGVNPCLIQALQVSSLIRTIYLLNFIKFSFSTGIQENICMHV